MPLRPSSTDPIVEAYYAACRAFTAVANPEEWTPEASAARTAAGLAHREALAVLRQAAEPGNPAIWHAMAHASAHSIRFLTPEEGLQRMRDKAAQKQRRRKPGAGEEPHPEKDEPAERAAAQEFWERRAAEAGLPSAMVSLALLLQRQERESVEAIGWLRRATALGSARAMIFLGFAFREGHGVEQDFHTAADWFQKAVAAGESHSLVHVGQVYASYLRDHAEGLQWFHRAAEAGRRDAFIYLAGLYADRESPVLDPAEALKWYHRAAETGGGSASRAMLELSNRYRDGVGTPADRDQARAWLVKHCESQPAGLSSRKKAEEALRKFDASLL